MAIVTIQHRRGEYADYDPSKVLPGELVVTQTGDPNTTDGEAAYIATKAGSVKRIPFASEVEDLKTEMDDVVEDAREAIESAIDPTLKQSGKAADAKAVGDEISGIREDLRKKTGLSEDVKVALLDCFEHVAWIDGHGQDYYDALYDALYPDSGLVRIAATFTQGSAVIYPSTPLNDLKAYLTVTGYYSDGSSDRVTDYALTGTLAEGTSVITVTAQGRTTTFSVVVSAPYWDFEWSATSKTIPEGMTYDAFDFTSESDALRVETPNLDFDHIGNCRIQIEMKSLSYTAGAISYIGSNPQIVIKNAVVSEGNFKGIKAIMNFTSGSVSGRLGIGINGTNTITDIRTFDDYHVYDVTAENGAYTLSVDGVQQTIQHNTNTSPYFAFTGLATSARTSETYYGAFIKSIKFKKL